MEPKKPIEINGGVQGTCFGPRNGDAWPGIVVGAFAVGHNHVKAINCAALKNGYQRLPAATDRWFVCASTARRRNGGAAMDMPKLATAIPPDFKKNRRFMIALSAIAAEIRVNQE